VRYESFLNPRPKIGIQLPVSWNRDITYRLNEIVESDYVLFKPVLDAAKKMNNLSQKAIQNFDQETALMHAWFTDLGEMDGVTILLATSYLRLLKVVDRERFDTALETMREKYEWRPIFIEANRQVARPGLSISTERAVKIVNETDPQYRGITFGDKFTLLGKQIIKVQDGLQVQLLWKSLADQELSYQHAIHLLDNEGCISSNLDYSQDRNENVVKTGTVWLDRIDIPRKKLENVSFIGVGIYSLPNIELLSVDRGPRDSSGKFVLLHLGTDRVIDSKVALEFGNKTDPGYRNISFGDRFMLVGFGIVGSPAGLRVKLAWKSLREQSLQYHNAVHLLDRHLNVLATLDYPQDVGKTIMKAATFWMDEIDIPSSNLTNVARIAIGIYSLPDVKLLSVDKGPRDWGGKRLLIPLRQTKPARYGGT
jgi:hypothetical protein